MNPRPTGPRRAAVELRFNGTSAALPSVAGRALHQYWSLLVPHFRGIFLPPQWRADGTGLNWAWREPATAAPLSPAELATVRKRLASAQHSLADTAADAPAADPRHAVVSLAQIQICTGELITALSTLPDLALSAYVVRTEQGPMLHSWGLSPALTPFYPDTTQLEISGTVFIAGRPAPDQEIALANTDGKSLARTRSDTDGRFRFLKLSPGHYCVRVISNVTPFPPKGVVLEIQRTAVTALELHDLAHRSPASTSVASASRRRRLGLTFTIVTLLLLAAGFWWWTSRPGAAKPVVSATAGALTSRVFTQASSDELASPTPDTSLPEVPKLSPPQTELSAAPPPRRSFVRPAAALIASPTGFDATASASAPSPGAVSPPASPPPANSAQFSKPAAATSSAATRPSPASAPTSAPPGPPPSPGVSPSATGDQGTAPASAPTPPLPPPVAKKSPPSPADKSPRPSEPPHTIAATPVTTTEAPRTPFAENPPVPVPAKNHFIESPAPAPVSPPPAAPPLLPVASPNPPSSPLVAADDLAARAFRLAQPDVENSVSLAPNSGISPSIPFAPASPHVLRFRFSPWQTRLLQDTILPTHPTPRSTPAIAVATVSTLRSRVFQERQAQLPLWLDPAHVRTGYALDLPKALLPAHWSAPRGQLPASATVIGTHAEFSWLASTKDLPASLYLVGAAGKILAAITVESDGSGTLTTIPEILGWPWIELSLCPPHAADWQVLRGPATPPSWRPNYETNRLDLAPGGDAPGLHQRSLAIVDAATGWALVSELALETVTTITAPPLSP